MNTPTADTDPCNEEGSNVTRRSVAALVLGTGVAAAAGATAEAAEKKKTMDIDPSEVRKLLDKQAIHEASLRYSRGIDRHDYELMASAYHPGANDDHGTYIGDAAGFVRHIASGDAKSIWSSRQHHLLNQTIDLDGDTAHVETYFIATQPRKVGPIDISGGRYVDRYERRDGRWAIADRICIVEWVGECPKSEKANPGLFFVAGTEDKNDVSYQRPLKVTRPHRDGTS